MLTGALARNLRGGYIEISKIMGGFDELDQNLFSHGRGIIEVPPSSKTPTSASPVPSNAHRT